MGNLFTLDSLREEADKAFAPIEVGLKDGTSVVLKPLLRLGREARTAALAALKNLEPAGDDAGLSLDDVDKLAESAENFIRHVAGARGDALVLELDGDIQLLMKVIQRWLEATQPGEAVSSPDSSTDTASA